MKDQSTRPSFILFKAALLTAAITVLQACGGGGSAGSDRDSTADASYKVTFTTAWTAASFPTNFPSGAHFSDLIGGTHNNQVIFWENGQPATDGIEIMAETGVPSRLADEVNAAKADGKAEFVLRGNGNGAAGTTVLEFDINQAYPLVTLVTMVAPSPDWFIGVHDLSLFDDTAGDWKQTVVVDLAVYDAGSDSGLAFQSGDADTQPASPISLLSSNPGDTDFVNGLGPNGEFIAKMTFERIK